MGLLQSISIDLINDVLWPLFLFVFLSRSVEWEFSTKGCYEKDSKKGIIVSSVLLIAGYCQIDYFENAASTPDPFFVSAGAAALVVSLTFDPKFWWVETDLMQFVD